MGLGNETTNGVSLDLPNVQPRNFLAMFRAIELESAVEKGADRAVVYFGRIERRCLMFYLLAHEIYFALRE